MLLLKASDLFGPSSSTPLQTPGSSGGGPPSNLDIGEGVMGGEVGFFQIISSIFLLCYQMQQYSVS